MCSPTSSARISRPGNRGPHSRAEAGHTPLRAGPHRARQRCELAQRALEQPQLGHLPDRARRFARRDLRDVRSRALPRAHVFQGYRAPADHEDHLARDRPSRRQHQRLHGHRRGRVFRRGSGDGDAPARGHHLRHAEPAAVRRGGGRARAQRRAPGTLDAPCRPRRLDLGPSRHGGLRRRSADVVVGRGVSRCHREGDARPAHLVPPDLLRAGVHVPGCRRRRHPLARRCPAVARRHSAGDTQAALARQVGAWRATTPPTCVR